MQELQQHIHHLITMDLRTVLEASVLIVLAITGIAMRKLAK